MAHRDVVDDGGISFDEFLEAQASVEDELFEKHKPRALDPPPEDSLLSSSSFSTAPPSSSPTVPLSSARAMFPCPDPPIVLVLTHTALVVGKLEGEDLHPIATVNAAGGKGFVEDIYGSEASIRVSPTCDFTFNSQQDKRDALRLFAHLCQAPYHQVVRGTLFSKVALQQDTDLEQWAPNANDTDQWGKTALHYAVGMPLNPLLGLLLQDLHADPNSLDDDLSTPLHEACRQGNAVAVVVLLRFGADVDVKDLHERTPFFSAAVAACRAEDGDDDALEAYSRTLESLVEAGCDSESLRDTEDRNALHYVLVEEMDSPQQIAVLQLLLHSPCSMDPNSASGELQRQPLHLLALQKEFASKRQFQLLLEHGARVNAGDGKGDTPLMLVLRGEAHYPFMTPDRKAIAAMLVTHGARLDVANLAGSTPLEAAKVQRLSFDQELLMWKSRYEPTQIVTQLLADPQLALNVPRTAAVTVDATNCQACRKLFSLLSWKTTCKRCGLGFCAACTSKQVTLLTGQQANKETVCDACFTSYCASVSRLGTALLEVRKSRESASFSKQKTTSTSSSTGNQDMQSLWRSKEQLLGGSAPASAEPQRLSAMEQTTSSISQAKARLGERGERLQSVNDKTAKMKEDAENFASMATKLRKQQENSMWPF